ncbi:MAG: Fe-S cluster assembly protein SufD, partial [Edaphobacter sp.]
MSTTIQQLPSYLETFLQLQKQSPVHHQDSWLKGVREAAFTSFCQLGFPTVRDEDWRFTSVAPIANATFQLAEDASASVTEKDVAPYRLEGLAAQLVFVNGHYAPHLSRLPATSNSLHVSSLAEAIVNNREKVEPYLARYADSGKEAFTALNTAFFEDGAFVSISRGLALQEPIYLLYLNTGGATQRIVNPRNLIVAAENSQATILEDYVSLAPGVSFTNVVTELVAADQAIVHHYRIERENTETFHVSTLSIQQERSSTVNSHSVLTGGALVRNNIQPILDGEGGNCLINGLFIGNGKQHLDNYMHVVHRRAHCGSHQFYNGILDGESRGVFHGRILVCKDAQQTDSKQTNRNLLLSDSAQMNTKPQLEIFADDVKCTHSATIGQIDEAALFYLRSRALDEAAAKGLLLFAFASECLDRMSPGSLRNYVSKIILRALPQSK